MGGGGGGAAIDAAAAAYDPVTAPYDPDYYQEKLDDWLERYGVFLGDKPRPLQ